MEENDKIQPQLPNQEFDYLKVAKILLSRWYWIVASVVLCYIIADVYIWYTPRIYLAQSTIKLDDRKNDNISNVLGEGVIADKSSRYQSESIILRGTNLITSAVKDLNYPVRFYIEGRVKVKTVELYPQRPVTIEILHLDTANFYSDLIKYRPLNSESFELTYKLNDKETKQNYAFGETVNIGNNSFRISKDNQDRATYLFGFNSLNDLAGRVRSEMNLSETQKNSNIVALSMTDANPQFASDALNAVMTEYVRYDRIQKQRSSDQIITFINDQLDTISEKVRQSNDAVETYKQSTGIVDIGSAGENQVLKSADLATQRDALQTQARLLREFRAEILANKNDAPISFPLEGGADGGLASLIAGFNGLVNQKNGWQQTYKEGSPPIHMIDVQLGKNKTSIISYLDKITDQIGQKLKYIGGQLNEVNKRMAMLPVAQQRLANLTRDFDINNKKYTFLSEKKLDAQISRSAVSTTAAIVEAAQPNFSQLSPDEHSIRRTAIFFGVLIGLGLIVLIRVLNPYIYDKETIESLTSIPIIGVIRRFSRRPNEDENEILVLSQPKSIFSESVRSVRTNLSYLASDKKNKVICVTSEVAGEGKSFVAVNLSSTLSLIDKKVILIAADLRRSKLHKTFHVANETGLSKYLSNQATLEEVILPTSQKNLDFIPSGPVPPNPSELLHTDKMKDLIEILRGKYDIVMVDTAPVGLVSDSIPLIRLSDVNVFVIRSGKSKYYAATIPQRIDNEYNLNNSVIILNAFEEDLLHSRYYTTRFAGGSYSGRYYYYSDYSGYESSGYYMDSQKKKWWDISRWLN